MTTKKQLKRYEKPTIETVEMQWAGCIAGSSVDLSGGAGSITDNGGVYAGLNVKAGLSEGSSGYTHHASFRSRKGF